MAKKRLLSELEAEELRNLHRKGYTIKQLAEMKGISVLTTRFYLFPEERARVLERRRNSESIKEYTKRYYQKNKKKIIEKVRRWQELNKDRVRKAKREYAKRHREYLSEYARVWREKRKLFKNRSANQ